MTEKMRTKELCAFIVARERVRQAKEKGSTPPWTTDPILRQYRFCNVHREHDRVTKWIARQWRDPNAGLDDLWFAMVVARLFNQPEALAAIGFPLPWRPEQVRKKLHVRRGAGVRNFNAAYIVSTNGQSMDKVDYVIDYVLSPLWADRKRIRPVAGETLETFHRRLMNYNGMGSFIAAQVVADLKYAQLGTAKDWHTWAASGPGSRRGLNRVLNRDVDSTWPGTSWLAELTRLRSAVLATLDGLALHAQDLQNCLCEFDKYERARLGEGKPKQIYQPTGE